MSVWSFGLLIHFRANFRRLLCGEPKAALLLGMEGSLIDVVGDAIAQKSFPTVVFHKSTGVAL